MRWRPVPSAVRGTLIALTLILWTAGCYTYKPVATVPAPGTEIQARLTNEAAIERSQGLDEPVTVLQGELLESNADGLRMVVVRDQLRDQFRRNVTFVDTLQVSTSEIQFVEVRSLSASRTSFMALAAAAAVALVVGAGINAGGDSGGDNGGGNPAQMIPLFRILPRR
jgi:hypothetical protein